MIISILYLPLALLNLHFVSAALIDVIVLHYFFAVSFPKIYDAAMGSHHSSFEPDPPA
jgi:hypothetical protein